MKLADLIAPPGLARVRAWFPGLDLDPVDVGFVPWALEKLFPNVAGVAVGRRIWVQHSQLEDTDGLLVLLVHELVHVQQWRRLGPIGFLVRYLCDYTKARVHGLGHDAAYRSIPAEMEAYLMGERLVRESLDQRVPTRADSRCTVNQAVER